MEKIQVKGDLPSEALLPAFTFSRDWLRRARARYPRLLQVIYFSLVQMIFLGVSNSLMSILSQFTHQNNRDWAGPVATMLLFLFSGFGSLYTRYLGRYKYNIVFFLSSLGQVFYVGSSIVFVILKNVQGTGVLIGVFILTAISGLVVSGFYMSQFYYTSVCAHLDKTGMYFGVNMAIAQCSNIIGNLLSIYSIQALGELFYAILMTCLIVTIALLFLLVKQPGTKEELEMVKLIEKRKQEELRSSENAKGPMSLLPAYYFTGVTVTFVYIYFSGFMYKAFPNDDKDHLYNVTFRILILEGVGELLGGLYVIFFTDRWSKVAQVLGTNNVFLVAACGCYVGYHTQSTILIGASMILMGFVNCAGFATDLAIIEEQRWGKRGYAIFNIAQCVGGALSGLLTLITDNSIEWYMVYMIACQLVSSAALSWFR